MIVRCRTGGGIKVDEGDMKKVMRSVEDVETCAAAPCVELGSGDNCYVYANSWAGSLGHAGCMELVFIGSSCTIEDKSLLGQREPTKK